MLPFEDRPWAKGLARFMIVFAIVGVAAGLVYLRMQGPLDTAEIVAAVLILLAIIPPNIAVLRYGVKRFERQKSLRIAH